MSGTRITLIILTFLSVFMIIGASFVAYFVPAAEPIYLTLYILGFLGTVLLGTAIPIFGDKENK